MQAWFAVGRRAAAAPRRWASSAPVAARCRDHYAYLETVDGLMYLHSSAGLSIRAELCVDLARELLELVEDGAGEDDVAFALEAIDTLNNVLCLVLDPAEATRNTHPDPRYREAASKAHQQVYQFMSVLNGSAALYNVLCKALAPGHVGALSEPMKRNAAMMKRDMDSFGIHRPDEEREVIMDYTNDSEALAGQLTQTADAAQRLRVLEALLLTRHRLARYLQQPSYAHWSMQPTMVASPEAAWRFLTALAARWREEPGGGRDDVRALLTVKHNMKYPTLEELPEGHDQIFDYEVQEMAGMYTKMLYPHADHITAYLSVANVWRGLEILCRELFDVDLVKEAPDAAYEQYHPLVEKYALFESGGGARIGTIYADLLEREGKLPTPCHFSIQLGTKLHARVLEEVDVGGPEGGRQLPVVIFSCNAKGRIRTEGECGWEEVLLSHDEAKAVLHEFGHALHTMFAQTELQNVAGTRSSLDYVEFPSQLFEYFATDYDVLRRFARHYATGAALPEEVLQQSNKRARAFRSLDRLEHIVLAEMDLVLHGPRPLAVYDVEKSEFVAVTGDGRGGGGRPGNAVNIEGEAGHSAYVPALRELYRNATPVVLTRYGEQRAFSLSHLSNYPAGYYSYEYSRVIAAWVWARYFDGTPLSKEGGGRLRAAMRLGASLPPRDMLAAAFGEVPDPCEMVSSVDLRLL